MSWLRTSGLTTASGAGNIDVASGNYIAVDDVLSPGMVVQTSYVTTMPTAHISSASATPVSAPLRPTFTPKYSSSVICVQFFSTMAYGAGGWLITTLRRSNDGGVTFTTLTPDTRAASRYQYGWCYNNTAWAPFVNVYFDQANGTTPIVYDIQYASSGTNYLVHQYQEYGWDIMEIAR